jgi:hypothetical protein
MSQTSACRTCGRPVRWVITAANNKKMPLDAKETPAGNIVLESGRAVVLGPGDKHPGLHYTSHFTTCPNPPKRDGRPNGRPQTRRSSASPDDVPSPTGISAALRSAEWQIRQAKAPKANAYIYLQAAAQVLVEQGVRPADIRAVVDGITRDHA